MQVGKTDGWHDTAHDINATNRSRHCSQRNESMIGSPHGTRTIVQCNRSQHRFHTTTSILNLRGDLHSSRKSRERNHLRKSELAGRDTSTFVRRTLKNFAFFCFRSRTLVGVTDRAANGTSVFGATTIVL